MRGEFLPVLAKRCGAGNSARSRPSGRLDPLESGSAGCKACPTVQTHTRYSACRTTLVPVQIRSSIRRLFGALGVNIEDILAAPTHGLGIILHAALSPVGGIGHGIFGNSAQEANF